MTDCNTDWINFRSQYDGHCINCAFLAGVLRMTPNPKTLHTEDMWQYEAGRGHVRDWM